MSMSEAERKKKVQFQFFFIFFYFRNNREFGLKSKTVTLYEKLPS